MIYSPHPQHQYSRIVRILDELCKLFSPQSPQPPAQVEAMQASITGVPEIQQDKSKAKAQQNFTPQILYYKGKKPLLYKYYIFHLQSVETSKLFSQLHYQDS